MHPGLQWSPSMWCCDHIQPLDMQCCIPGWQCFQTGVQGNGLDPPSVHEGGHYNRCLDKKKSRTRALVPVLVATPVLWTCSSCPFLTPFILEAAPLFICPTHRRSGLNYGWPCVHPGLWLTDHILVHLPMLIAVAWPSFMANHCLVNIT